MPVSGLCHGHHRTGSKIFHHRFFRHFHSCVSIPNDQKTYGELFFVFCDDIQDMDLTNALQSLMDLFVEHISTLSADITSVTKGKVTEWISSQASLIQVLFGNMCWES